MSDTPHFTLGALPTERGTRFRVWAPAARTVELVLEDKNETLAMTPESGYFTLEVPGVGAGARYRYRLDGQQLYPDPASRFQPDGVHGPSEVVDPARYRWRHPEWSGVPQAELIFYEVHVGTFSPAGTFDGVREKLPYLKALGVTALELMPVADFPGRWNWGYDGAALYAPSRAYGTPDDLRRLVDEAHGHGLAVFLDVVYNHFGPDGSYAVAYDPNVLTERYATPWGKAVNLENPALRRYFTENALMWLHEYRLDGFRLDAIFALYDESQRHWLAEMSAAAHALPGVKRVLVGEDYRNERIVITLRDAGGHGLDAVWADDFHHHLRRALTGDAHAYFGGYSGESAAIAETLTKGWYYDGKPHRITKEPRGSSAEGIRPEQLVYCIQNHDQIGNRPLGDRLSQVITPAAYRAASALLLFAPALPLLFMGQEWAASTPFLFFTDHEPELGARVREGRKEEFGDFPGFDGEVPDPQSPATFQASKLDWSEPTREPHAKVLALYRDLLELRPTLAGRAVAESPTPGGLIVRRGEHLLLVALEPDLTLPISTLPISAESAGETGWEEVWCSEDERYTDDPHPPRFTANGVHFGRAGALLVRI